MKAHLLDSLGGFFPLTKKILSKTLTEHAILQEPRPDAESSVTSTLVRQCHTEGFPLAGWKVDVQLGAIPQPKLISSTQKLRMSLKTKCCADPDLKITFFLVHKLLRKGSVERTVTWMLFSILSNKDSSKNT